MGTLDSPINKQLKSCGIKVCTVYVHILEGRPASAGFCYGESAPASFDVCELVAMEDSCYSDGQV